MSFYDESEFSFLDDVKYITDSENVEQLKEEYSKILKYT